MKSFRVYQWNILSISLISIGVSLLGIASLGQWTSLGNYRNTPARSWECFDPHLAKKTPSLNALYAEAQTRSQRPLEQLTPHDAMQVLYEVTACRFTHGDRDAQHTLFSNSILWSIGFIDHNFKVHYNVDHLLKYGHSGFCSQVSFVLIKLAERARIPARLVHLNGHVVMEAWYNDDWHMYDADMEVVPIKNDRVVSLEELSRDKALTFETYKFRPETEKWVNTVVTRIDNFADRVDRINSASFLQLLKITEYLKFLLPLFLAIGSFRMYRYKH
ncbi:hypothetical protein [Dendronalium sp. ChiSLP03b]|uniref:hypothetical protein n=1 Tax=Dendronalium sp. ChiSLP03b TaxID=3075381 RepID=UPI002AD58CE7|nr:hypothetical protein [Dendronalium sp. ChiSLP03b]MDZ8204096.1 hypothetical protein [Dendronalium sp. ChiSLP03b]